MAGFPIMHISDLLQRRRKKTPDLEATKPSEGAVWAIMHAVISFAHSVTAIAPFRNMHAVPGVTDRNGNLRYHVRRCACKQLCLP